MRRCRRNACASPASASLTFRYDTAQAWLEDLAREAEPQRWDLCHPHASMMTVPVGWELLDVRSEEWRVVDVRSEDDLAERATTEVMPAVAGSAQDGRAEGATGRAGRRDRWASPRRRPNRYAELSARLPALAAEVAARSAWSGPPGRSSPPGSRPA